MRERTVRAGPVLAGALVALFASSLTNTIIGIALPTIAGELGGQDQVAWVAAAALLTLTAATPVWGKLADRRGPRPMLLAATAGFVVASLAAGLAPSMAWLVTGRALQGAAAGGVLACTNALIAVLVPARERGRYTGWFGISFGSASVAGPLLGGLLVTPGGPGWRWCFLGVVPVTVLAALLIRLAPDRRPPRPTAPLDHLGAALLALSSGGLVVLLSAGGHAWPWLSPATFALATVVLVTALLAVLREHRVPDPILPPRLFRSRTFTIACTAGLLVGTVMFGGMIYLPQFLQVVHGHGAMAAGLLMLPQLGTMVVSSALTGRLIVRTGRWKRYPATGCALLVAGLGVLAPLSVTTPAWQVAAGMALLGAGSGLTIQVLVLAAQDAVAPGDVGVASSSAMFTRMLGGAVGVAAFGALIAARLRADLPAALGAAGLPATDEGVRRLLGTPARVAALPPPLAEAVRESYTNGLQLVFLVTLPVAVLALVAVLLVRETALGEAVPAH
ncbi:MFS transporter [Amycolatopsis sp. YIM 10]|uniref:MFS transporter n=1 Tax=Amycolatopsis sp. YIM 10 TaxID=2653857 RepID=UPI0012A78968|nr:MFS transporter [Amycolatopsis sp. YIM 10]QFU89952.1 Multidrug resistance protein 3 [Amycolatopsis sp. YIM 10]